MICEKIQEIINRQPPISTQPDELKGFYKSRKSMLIYLFGVSRKLEANCWDDDKCLKQMIDTSEFQLKSSLREDVGGFSAALEVLAMLIEVQKRREKGKAINAERLD